MSELNLAQALKNGDLEPFIAKCEAAGIGPASQSEFDELLGRIVKAPQPVDQTSRSRGRGGSTGK